MNEIQRKRIGVIGMTSSVAMLIVRLMFLTGDVLRNDLNIK